ncbi:MAG: hypothetical protein OSJ64_05935, partial [Firmicutes bacterium]|nr:hypothetical protein [Bacillota bacterium]
ELSQLLQQDSGFVAEVERLKQAATEAAAELQAQEAEIAAQEETFAAQRDAVEELQAEQEQARQEILDNSSQLANLQNEQSFLAKSLAAGVPGLATARQKILTEMAENKSGFYPGVRAVLRAKRQGRPQMIGVLGVVLDLIESDVQYSLALEAAVGAGLQNIVVQDDRAARACVAYLKQEKLGRATFLPLASLKWRANAEIEQALAAAYPGVIGRCAQVIQCAPAVRPAVEFLFANTLLVEDLDVATEVARLHRQQFKIVTLAGDIISPGGSITGGSRQKNAGDLLQKKNQLVELQRNVAGAPAIWPPPALLAAAVAVLVVALSKTILPACNIGALTCDVVRTVFMAALCALLIVPAQVEC